MDVVRNEPAERSVTVRWRVADLDRIRAAAARLAQREGVTVSNSDIIRSGAIRRADEILADEAA